MDKLIETSKKAGINRIDTAAALPGNNPGGTEKLLGNLELAEHGFIIDSKVIWSGNGDGTLTAEAVEKSVAQSLESLKVSKVSYSLTSVNICSK